MNKWLIINADDFGWDDSSSEAIVDLLDQDKISSTTIMANLVSDDHLEQIAGSKQFSTGIHLNLISGKPLSADKAVPGLVDENGDFWDAGQLFKKFLTGKIRTSEIRTEIEAQLKRLEDAGIFISHADSHQHLHQFPLIGKIILDILRDHGIERVRNCRLTRIPTLRAGIISLFSMLTQHHLKSFLTTRGLIPDLSFATEFHASFLEQIILRAFRNHDVLEIMTHPAISDRSGSYLHRKAEYEFWKNLPVREILDKHRIQLISWHQL